MLSHTTPAVQNKTISFKIAKLADLAAIFGKHWRVIWNRIKADTGTSQRKPRSVSIMSDARQVILNDGECAKRFAVDMLTGELSERSLHVSSGEWACHGGSNNDQGVTGLPANTLVVTVIWQEYYRSLSLDVQANAEMMSAATQGNVELERY